jgi:hypothetical protein
VERRPREDHTSLTARAHAEGAGQGDGDLPALRPWGLPGDAAATVEPVSARTDRASGAAEETLPRVRQRLYALSPEEAVTCASLRLEHPCPMAGYTLTALVPCHADDRQRLRTGWPVRRRLSCARCGLEELLVIELRRCARCHDERAQTVLCLQCGRQVCRACVGLLDGAFAEAHLRCRTCARFPSAGAAAPVPLRGLARVKYR